MKIGSQTGFTFVEMIIVVAIIAILAGIAYPSYQQYVSRSKRVAAQSDMLDIAARLQRYKVVNFTFMKAGNTPVTLADIGHNGLSPQSGPTMYNLVLSDVTAGTWILTATPAAGTSQSGTGLVILNSNGERCWDKDGGSCTLTTASNWDGR